MIAVEFSTASPLISPLSISHSRSTCNAFLTSPNIETTMFRSTQCNQAFLLAFLETLKWSDFGEVLTKRENNINGGEVQLSDSYDIASLKGEEQDLRTNLFEEGEYDTKSIMRNKLIHGMIEEELVCMGCTSPKSILSMNDTFQTFLKIKGDGYILACMTSYSMNLNNGVYKHGTRLEELGMQVKQEEVPKVVGTQNYALHGPLNGPRTKVRTLVLRENPSSLKRQSYTDPGTDLYTDPCLCCAENYLLPYFEGFLP